MRLCLPTIALLSGCSATDPDAGVLPVPICTGEGYRLDAEGEARGWFTTSVDAELRTLSHLTWWDADRTELGSREVNLREGDLLLVSRLDVDGDGRDEYETVRTYDALDRPVIEETRVSGELDEAGTGIAGRLYTVWGPDGRMAEKVVDTYGDGELETLHRYRWADGRQEQVDTVWLAEDRPSEVTTWTWFDAPPGLDHVEEHRVEGQDVPYSTTERQFDPAGNLVFEARTWGGGAPSLTEWTRDADGRVMEVLESSEGGSVRSTYAHDARGLPLGIVRESDTGSDGIVEDVQTTEWAWSCIDG